VLRTGPGSAARQVPESCASPRTQFLTTASRSSKIPRPRALASSMQNRSNSYFAAERACHLPSAMRRRHSLNRSSLP
jgi:hypothetical protein